MFLICYCKISRVHILQMEMNETYLIIRGFRQLIQPIKLGMMHYTYKRELYSHDQYAQNIFSVRLRAYSNMPLTTEQALNTTTRDIKTHKNYKIIQDYTRLTRRFQAVYTTCPSFFRKVTKRCTNTRRTSITHVIIIT